MKITLDQATEFSVHKFSVEASTLGLAPGRWPNVLETNLGNGQRFVLEDINDIGGHYRQQYGCITLIILND